MIRFSKSSWRAYMDRRLRHSYSAYLRAMQISRTDLFIFVEGTQSDSYFYGRVCESTRGLRVRYEICMARQLPGGAGGKQALLNFFSFLRQRRALVSLFAGRNTTCIFFLDKDLDDLQHKKKRSAHIVYTEHYDVQNYIFMHGNLLTAAAAAASVDPGRLRAELNDAPGWCRRIAELWREWIALCLCVSEEHISCQANYRVLSQVQTRPCGPVDAAKCGNLTRVAARKGRLPVADLRLKLAGTTSKVDKYYARGQHHRVFKGKWFANVLADDIDRIMAGLPY
ncbi:MAG: DUF4435 domain-containing protein, partial [Chloroflexota bacterium]